MLEKDSSGEYVFKACAQIIPCIQDVDKLDTQVRLGKVKLGKDRIGESMGEESPSPSEKHDYNFYSVSYNCACTKLPSFKILTEKRKKAIREFEKLLSKDQFKEVCQKANNSKFCTGDNGRGWKADFDFLIKPDKATNVLEGKYDNVNGSNGPPSFDISAFENDSIYGISKTI